MATNIESIDTNIILRIILGDVPQQREKALRLLEQPDTTYFVADLAITESVYVLQKTLPRHEIASNLSDFLSEPNINYNRTLFDQVFPIYTHHPSLSFNDCCLAAYAALNHAEPLWTFDRTLAHQSPTAKELK